MSCWVLKENTLQSYSNCAIVSVSYLADLKGLLLCCFIQQSMRIIVHVDIFIVMFYFLMVND